MAMTFSEIRKALCDAFTAAFPGSGGDIVDIYTDRCIIRDNTGAMYEVPYTIDPAGNVATGDLTRVRRRVQYVMVQTNSMTLPEGPQGTLPEEIQVVPYGRYETPKGPFVFDEESAGLVMAGFEAQRNDMVIDYEHQTFADPPVQAPAAGWIKKLVNKGKEGLWAVVEWTDKAKEYIANREYRYFSPVFLKRAQDNKVIRLFNGALTNLPNIDGMVPLINKAIIDAERRAQSAKTQKEDGMDKELLKLLGLPETATLQDVTLAINKLKTPVTIVANKAVLTALGLAETAGESEVTGTIMAMKRSHDQVGELQSQVTALTNKLTERESSEAVDAAMAAGKITPAQKDWAMDYAKRDLPGFQVFVAKAPVVMVPGKTVKEQKPGDVAIDDTQTMINKMCGVDEETFKKFGPKETA